MVINKQNWRMTDDNEIIKERCEEIRKLLSQSYWAKDRTIEVIEKSVEHSICFAIFDRETDGMVAFARVVTDYTTVYYLCDVIVDAKYRGKGLGKMLVGWITNQEDRLKGLHGILLTDDAQGLFSQFGFGEYKNSCMCIF